MRNSDENIYRSPIKPISKSFSYNRQLILRNNYERSIEPIILSKLVHHLLSEIKIVLGTHMSL